MGKGKGSISHYESKINKGSVIFNLFRISRFRANKLFKKLSFKMDFLQS